ncbi:MAG: hypothetical protein ACPGJS_09510 [Flammeovirgaceae bacterium]
MKKYISSILFALLVLVSTSCEEDNYEDDFFNVVNKWGIIGPAEVTSGETVEFRTRFEDGVSYTWTVPTGATITSTYPATHYRIEVTFGTTSGDVTVSGAGLDTGSLTVTVD